MIHVFLIVISFTFAVSIRYHLERPHKLHYAPDVRGRYIITGNETIDGGSSLKTMPTNPGYYWQSTEHYGAMNFIVDEITGNADLDLILNNNSTDTSACDSEDLGIRIRRAPLQCGSYVGINQPNPTCALDVVGDYGCFSGNVTIGGDLTVDGSIIGLVPGVWYASLGDQCGDVSLYEVEVFTPSFVDHVSDGVERIDIAFTLINDSALFLTPGNSSSDLRDCRGVGATDFQTLAGASDRVAAAPYSGLFATINCRTNPDARDLTYGRTQAAIASIASSTSGDSTAIVASSNVNMVLSETGISTLVGTIAVASTSVTMTVQTNGSITRSAAIAGSLNTFTSNTGLIGNSIMIASSVTQFSASASSPIQNNVFIASVLSTLSCSSGAICSNNLMATFNSGTLSNIKSNYLFGTGHVGNGNALNSSRPEWYMAVGQYPLQEPTNPVNFTITGQRVFVVCHGTSNAARLNLMSITNVGDMNLDGNYYSGGAYLNMQYMENAAFGKIEDGTVVTRTRDGRIREAQSGERIIGVVCSKCHGFVSNADSHQWHGKYVKDAYGHPLREEYYDDEGFIKQRLILSPEFDSNREHIPRAERPHEWSRVARHGAGDVLIRDGQETHAQWFHLHDKPAPAGMSWWDITVV